MRSEAEFSPWLQVNFFLVGSSTIGLGQIILGYLNGLYSGWVSVRVGIIEGRVWSEGWVEVVSNISVWV